MKKQLHDIPKDQVVSTGTMVNNILQDRVSTIHCFVDQEVAIKRETPTRCWSMAQILEAVKNQFGDNALAEARRYLIQDVFNLKDRQ